MAVYKATYCYPLGNSLDIRVVANQETLTPCKWFKCQIDSSNKLVTGYKIRIFDNLNKQIFPLSGSEKISPISELKDMKEGDSIDAYLNTGLNGSALNIPFFQNYNYSTVDGKNTMLLPSFNAIYYKPRFKVDYIVANLDDWNLTTDIYGNEYLQNPQWNGRCDFHCDEDDAEMTQIGETVLCCNGSGTSGANYDNKIGIWQITGVGSLERYKETANSSAIVRTDLADKMVTVVHASNHNSVYEADSNGIVDPTDPYSTPKKPADDLWCDINGQSVNLSMDGQNYKWEITLYQGDVPVSVQSVTIGSTSINVGYMDYSELDFEWYDSTLSSGTILGSTNKRIQLASENSDNGILPEGSPSMPIVLQGKYIQLYNNQDCAQSHAVGKRVYIQTYDATYGHVYPIAGKLGLNDINNAVCAQCFKYSNDPDYILESDRVTVATIPQTAGVSNSGNLNIWIKSGNEWTANTQLGTPIIDGYQTKDGDLILVKDQTYAWENGVYVIKMAGTAWYRSGSFRNWADFMGKIIYVNDGATNGGLNFQSSAQTFGTIFNPTQGDNGNSPLYFIEERPITLFPSLLKTTVDYLALTSYDPSTSDWMISSTYVMDGYEVNQQTYVGQTLLVSGSNHMFKITEVAEDSSTDPHTFKFKCTAAGNINSTDVVHINYGKTYGGADIQTGGSSTPTIKQGPSRAIILKNSATKTFISPYINLQIDMALQVQNHIKFYYDESGVKYPTNWIRIKEVNKTLWYITHDQYYKDEAGTVKVFESMSETDTSIPYTYDLKTYYKASDENPFYVYESPYLKMSRIGLDVFNEQVDYATSNAEPDLLDWNISASYVLDGVTVNSSSFEGKTFIRYVSGQIYTITEVSNDGAQFKCEETGDPLSSGTPVSVSAGVTYGGKNILLDGTLNPKILIFPYYNTVNGRYIVFEGAYYQFQQASWESYQWTLKNYNGDVIQDSGKRYDKEMKVQFYGLSNDPLNNGNYYVAELSVIDSVGNTLEASVVFIVNPDQGEEADVNFTADFDCNTHSVVLAYQDTVYLAPTQKDVLNRDELAQTDWDIFTLQGTYFITEKSAEDGYNLYLNDIYLGDQHVYTKGAGTDDVSVNIPLMNIYADNITGISKHVEEGLDYSHYLLLQQLDENELVLDTDMQTLKINGNEAYCETQITLNNNYCGNILSYQIDNIDGINKTSILKFVIATNENFINTDTSGYVVDNLNSTRNQFKVTVQKIVETDKTTKVKEDTGITFFTIPSGTSNRYILQPSLRADAAEYHLFTDDGALFYIPVQIDNKIVCYNSTKPLGNCCLFASGVDRSEITYWSEEWGTLKYCSTSEESGHVDYGTGINLRVNDDLEIPYWPASDEEDNYFWSEEGNSADYSETVETIAPNDTLHEFYVMTRRPKIGEGIKNDQWLVILKVFDIEGLYYHLNDIRWDTSVSNTVRIVSDSGGSQSIYAEIYFRKLNNQE